jgi:hypothetical protein
LLQNAPLGRSRKNQVGLKLYGTRQLLVYVDDNLLGDNISTIQRNTEGSKEAGLEVSTERSDTILTER